MEPDTSRRPELPGLQYLRGLAAVGVVVCHISTMMTKAKYLGHRPFSGALEHGRFGVDIFFALSGFIMVYIALEADLTPRTRAAPFLRDRFTRIAPFLWLVVFVFALLRWTAKGAFVAEDYLRAVTFFPIGEVAPTQAWTLRFEVFFYLVFATSLLCIRPLRWVGVLWLLGSTLVFPLFSGCETLGWRRELLWFVFNPLNLLFAAGALAGWIFMRFDRPSSLAPWTVFFLLPLAILIKAVALAAGYNRLALAPLLLTASLLGAMLYFAASIRPTDHIAARGFKLLGDASYSIYLTHGIFLAAALGVAARGRAMPDIVLVTGLLVVCMAGGVAAHLYIERPLLSVVRRKAWHPGGAR